MVEEATAEAMTTVHRQNERLRVPTADALLGLQELFGGNQKAMTMTNQHLRYTSDNVDGANFTSEADPLGDPLLRGRTEEEELVIPSHEQDVINLSVSHMEGSEKGSQVEEKKSQRKKKFKKKKKEELAPPRGGHERKISPEISKLIN